MFCDCSSTSPATIIIGPLKPGTYNFVGEYHESTTQGRLVAKWTASMLATVIIAFREVPEAALVVSIVLAATRGVLRRGL